MGLGDPWGLVRIALVVEGVLLIVALVLVFGHGWVEHRYERRWSARIARARTALREVVRTGRADRSAVALLGALPMRIRIRLFTELTPHLAGRVRAQLARLAFEVGLVPRAERMLRSRDWRERVIGVRLLGAVGDADAGVVPLLDDPHPAVRAEAVEWAGSNATPELVDRLVGLLPAAGRYNGFVIRDALSRLGSMAVPSLVRFLERHSGRHAVAALDVAAGLADARFGPAALRLCADDLPAVRSRAAVLAGAVGGTGSVDVLVRLLGDVDAEVRAAASVALGRLGHWPAAGAIAALLRDPSWDVRSRSALALRDLGSPGRLYLQRTLDDEDAFAADIARQVLDLPEQVTETERRP